MKIASAKLETIRFQDKILVILNANLELETYIKGIMFTRKYGL